MTPSEWQACKDPKLMMDWLSGRWFSKIGPPMGCMTDRKLHLFNCAMYRSYRTQYDRHLIVQGCRIMEAFAEGRATADELKGSYYSHIRDSSALVTAFAWCSHPPVGSSTQGEISDYACSVLYELFGPAPTFPFYTPASWKTRLVLQLAELCYWTPAKCPGCDGTGHDGEFDTTWTCVDCFGTGYDETGTLDGHGFLLLADALEELGCEDPAVLSHLRTPWHLKGCHVLDRLLGKC